MSITLEPIAHVVGGRSEPSDDFWGGTRAIIRLEPHFDADTLLGIEEFSHLQVIWHFHRASPQDIHLGARHPRNNPAWPSTGTFVHHNHRRPAQVGISHPRLLKVDGLDLHVEDLDAIDGTPVVDLAPWFAEFGPRGEVAQPAWPAEMLSRYWDRPNHP
jgi:tRNA (Thr-GGU) A37 N-methylase